MEEKMDGAIEQAINFFYRLLRMEIKELRVVSI